MSDRLYLSCWLRDPSPEAVLAQFEALLGRFPFSKLAKRGPELRVYAVDMTEPPAAEREFLPGVEASAIAAVAREAAHDDTVCMVDTFWDLWQLETDWSLLPAGVTLACYGPKFDNDFRDHLRIDFGLDAKFLPSAGEGARMAQENIRSLLHLVGDLDGALPLAKRQLWSESGDSFTELLSNAISGLGVH